MCHSDTIGSGRRGWLGQLGWMAQSSTEMYDDKQDKEDEGRDNDEEESSPITQQLNKSTHLFHYMSH